MRLHSRRPLSRLLLVSACAGALNACSGGSGSSYNPPGGGYSPPCSPGTNVQLANPTPNAFGVPTNTGTITIVANGNANQLYQTYGAWNVVLQGGYGPITGGALSLVPDPSGPHPFPSDFYYSSSFATLPSGQNFTVQLANGPGFCAPVTIGSFTTQ